MKLFTKKPKLLSDLDIPHRVFDEYHMQGFSQFTIPNYLEDYLDQLKDEIKFTNLVPDYLPYSETERRFHSFQKSNSKVIKLFNLFGISLYTKIFNKSTNLDILAMDNIPIKDNRDIENRWHVDSRGFQFKLFIYLNDVNEDNAPFQLLKNTYRTRDKIKLSVRHKNFMGPYLGFNKIRKIHNFQSISDEFINDIKSDYPIHTFIGKAGTCFIANTSCIHRDSPCLSGYRSSLHYYYE